jgi:hypothetical protein
MKLTTLFATLAIASVVGIAGCKKDDFEKIDSICPVVLFTSPGTGETNVPLQQTVTATFNEKMDPASITDASFFLLDGARVAGTVSYTGQTASFDPTSNLTPNVTYVATVTTLAKDMMGNTLQTKYVWSFSTGSSLSPVVISTDPASSGSNTVLNKRITASFNMPMNPLTISTATFRLAQGTAAVSGAISYTDSTASFTPAAPLLPNASYTATITTGAQNPGGAALANDHVWAFTTGAVMAPTVISTDPGAGATGVALSKVVNVTFSEPMDAGSLDTSSFTLTLGTTPVPGAVSYSGTVASYTPTVNLYSETTYTATIRYAVKNLNGVSLANEYTWTFTTDAHLGPQAVDLKSVERFGIIAGMGVSNNAGFSEIHDLDVGISPGNRSSLTGFPPALVMNGAIYCSDDIAPPGTAAMLTQAEQDLTDAYLFAEGAVAPAPSPVAGDLGGLTLAPGIYKSVSTLMVQSGDLTLDGQGDANAVWIFQVAAEFTTIGGAGGNIILSGGAQAQNVFWQVGSSATIGAGTQFKGNILALTSITLNSDAVAQGRMLARNGAVTMTNTNIITR